jgi:hypothetical protein
VVVELHQTRRQVAIRLGLLLTAASLTGCAGSVRPALLPSKPQTEALLILPGLGYNRAAERTFRSLEPMVAAQGIDLYVADYVTRSGLAESRARLQRFIRDNRLDRYQRVHVFAFLAGGWTLNPLVEQHPLPNLATVIYDRSPLQERAPMIAAERLQFLAWLRYGSTVFDLARTSYPPLAVDNVKVGLLVETAPTSFIRRYAPSARAYGPFAFECDAFVQRYDDCMYVGVNHNELYDRFAEVLPDLFAFIRTGRFRATANRQPPVDDVLVRRHR